MRSSRSCWTGAPPCPPPTTSGEAHTDLLSLLTAIIFSRCGCEDCAESRGEDSLRHSRRRINAYRALASPSLIALSSKDPILTAFELSWELKQLAFDEYEFKSEYLVSKRIRRSSVWGNFFYLKSFDLLAQWMRALTTCDTIIYLLTLNINLKSLKLDLFNL